MTAIGRLFATCSVKGCRRRPVAWAHLCSGHFSALVDRVVLGRP